ncbi:MAG: anion permease, partial [Planctomycetes bacterium]|nr:anion permease [Planctomycetota bacterium]
QSEGEVLLVEGVSQTLTAPRRAPIAVAVLLGIVIIAMTGWKPMVVLALAGAACMLLLRCLEVRDATRALDSSVLLLLVGMIPLGVALEKTGLAANLAQGVVHLVGDRDPVIVISALYLLTSLLTEVLSNNATAVLLAPIGLGVSAQLDIDAKPILMAIAIGASASFATPIGYQTNTMVMGPGGYRFRDYLRYGVPLNLLMWLVATALIPFFFPL